MLSSYPQTYPQIHRGPMLRIILIMLLSLVMLKAWACFDLEKIELKDHVLIKGMSVNHRLIFIDDNQKEIQNLGVTEITDQTGKRSRKGILDFNKSTMRLVPDKLPSNGDNIVQIKFITLGKTIRIEIDPTKAAAKSITRSGGCGGKLEISQY